jgi:hypothetical protein
MMQVCLKAHCICPLNKREKNTTEESLEHVSSVLATTKLGTALTTQFGTEF